jgi:hypothetical protein
MNPESRDSGFAFHAPRMIGYHFLPVIASEAKQSIALAGDTSLDCFVASFLAMTGMIAG